MPSWWHVQPNFDLGVENLRWHVELFPKVQVARLGAYKASGDQSAGFSIREVKEHVCVVSFLKGRLVLHKSEIEAMGLLEFVDLGHSSDTTMVVLWELCDAVGPDLKASMDTTVDLCYACINILYCVEMFVDAKNETWL